MANATRPAAPTVKVTHAPGRRGVVRVTGHVPGSNRDRSTILVDFDADFELDGVRIGQGGARYATITIEQADADYPALMDAARVAIEDLANG